MLAALALAAVLAADQEKVAAPPPPNQLSPAEVKEGWRLLFDGRTAAGWRGYRAPQFPDQSWVIEDGALHVKAGGGGHDLVTQDEFSSFELRFEWKVARGANSGVMYRVAETADTPWQTGPEYQVLDDDVHPDGKNPLTSAASLYGMIAPQGKALHTVGDWNQARIVIQGDHVEHWLNGVKVLEFQLGGPAWDAMVAKSKFASFAGFGRQKTGHIDLQDHGDDVWYRSLRIRELPAVSTLPAAVAGEVTLFNGKDLSGWTCFLENGGKLEDVWSVDREGVLICKGQPIGYLRTEADYTNYVLRLEWRFNPVTKQAGNSGVLLRMQAPDKVWPRSIEAQLESGNAGDFWNIDEFPMKVAADRTSGRNTKKTHGNERPIGEWNQYEITVDHGKVTLAVNGQVLNEASDCAELPGKICLQSEGAEIHFRNIRLTRLP